MRKLFFIPTIVLLGFCISHNELKAQGKLSATAQKNLDVNHSIIKMFETKDFSKIGDYIAEDAVDHAGEQGDVKGVANLKAEFEKMSATMEKPKNEIIKELADDEYVMSWMRSTGTLKVDMMGMKAGDKFDMNGIELTKFKNGKAVEHWSFMQPSDMMKMMGGKPH